MFGDKNLKLWFGPQQRSQPTTSGHVLRSHDKREGWHISELWPDQGIKPEELLCRIANDLGYEFTSKEPAKIVRKPDQTIFCGPRRYDPDGWHASPNGEGLSISEALCFLFEDLGYIMKSAQPPKIVRKKKASMK